MKSLLSSLFRTQLQTISFNFEPFRLSLGLSLIRLLHGNTPSISDSAIGMAIVGQTVRVLAVWTCKLEHTS